MDKLDRRQSPQTVAWFRDLYKRGLLDLDPTYQRRSVWNLRFREFFIETVLLEYPAPPIFLHELISDDGIASYSVVDGKQRLTTLFDFAEDLFSIAADSILARDRGKVFSQLDRGDQQSFWRYQFSVEFLPTTDETVLTSIFDRINRNVARLTPQELRHARYSGIFAASVEEMADYLEGALLEMDAPHIVASSRRQMKDVELTAQLVLFAENGPETFSQDELDFAYSERDDEWENRSSVEKRFRRTIDYLQELWHEPDFTAPHMRRLRNQADFYSLFGSILTLDDAATLPDTSVTAQRLADFMVDVADEDTRLEAGKARDYYLAARSASNDLRQREARIEILKAVILGEED